VGFHADCVDDGIGAPAVCHVTNDIAEFAGMLPEGVQNWTIYAGAMSPAARNKDSALTLMSILADPSIDPILKRRGLEPPY